MRARDTLSPEVERDLDAMDAAVAGHARSGGDALLAELAVLVAEARPAAGSDRLGRLDARAARAFTAPPRRLLEPLRGRLLAPVAGLAACAVLALSIGVATLRGGSDGRAMLAPSSDGGGEAGGVNEAAPGAATSQSRDAASSAMPDLAPAVGIAPPSGPAAGDPGSDRRSDRKVERSAAMTLTARPADIDAVAARAGRVAVTLGGFVAAASVASGDGGTLDLRVPSARLDDAVARLSRLARVRSLERSSLDITAQAVSARSRLTDARTERRSLLRQLALATTLAQTTRIRDRLASVSGQLERARAQVRRVGNRAAFADVSVSVVPQRREVAGGGWTPRDALRDALRVLEVAAGIALVAFAVALPLVLLGAPAWLAGRRLRRLRRERALDAA